MNFRFDRDWKKIEDFIGSKTVIQYYSQSCAEILFKSSEEWNGGSRSSTPCKASHPYPTWDDASVLANNPSTGAMPSENNYNFLGGEGTCQCY
ncbi:hypothetical protein CASFOL_002370 [Castilleja foliolosa]|uniref:Uncharacterized protein n=1 Tax=Castilleja foliolosa TaxID=1961234 RepID=A0ABD3EHM3_9LAMI